MWKCEKFVIFVKQTFEDNYVVDEKYRKVGDHSICSLKFSVAKLWISF